jgi:hypothetical protein
VTDDAETRLSQEIPPSFATVGGEYPSAANSEEECTHPNGFGVNGCPCGETVSAVTAREFPMPTLAGIYVEHMSPQSVSFDAWWTELVAKEAPTIAAKAAEYGSNSLAAMGRLYARGQGREVGVAEALELGCAVYAYGKMQRIADSMIRGTLPSEDTVKDTMIYMAMTLFIKEHKRWP